MEDSRRGILTESTAFLNRWTKYCSGLYNCDLHPDASLPKSNQTHTQEAESLFVLREEIEEAVLCLKAGKSSGVDNIPSELLKNGAETTTAVCQKTWEMKE